MNLGFGLTPYSAVREVIENWVPRNFDSEEQYEESLERELKKSLKDQKIERQYIFDKQRADIVVDDDVPIELKNDITTDQDIIEIKNQLDGYIKKWERVFLVICGNISDGRLEKLRKYAEKRQGFLDSIFGIEVVEIILKNGHSI